MVKGLRAKGKKYFWPPLKALCLSMLTETGDKQPSVNRSGEEEKHGTEIQAAFDETGLRSLLCATLKHSYSRLMLVELGCSLFTEKCLQA